MSFPLSSTRGLYHRGVISSTEVAEEAVLEGSMTGAGGVMEIPFSTTRIVLFSMMERGSFFLPLIFAYIPWLNLVVIPTTKHLLKKKKERKGLAMMNLTLTLFFFNFNSLQNRSKRLWTKAVKN